MLTNFSHLFPLLWFHFLALLLAFPCTRIIVRMGRGPATFYHGNDVTRRDKCAWVRLKWRSAHVFRHSGVFIILAPFEAE